MTFAPQETAESLPVAIPIAVHSYESSVYRSNPEMKRNMRAIYDACMKEMSIYCGEEAVFVQKLYITDSVDSEKIKEDSLRMSHDCMMKHLNLYSRHCQNTIIKFMVTPDPNPAQHYGTGQTSTGMPGWNPTPPDQRIRFEPHPKHQVDPYAPPNPYSYGEDGRMMHPPRYGGGDNSIDAYRFDTEERRPDQGHGGHGNGHHNHHHFHHHHHGVHPVAWVFILPFFCVGVFVSIKFVAGHIRRYRASNGSREYMPLRGPQEQI